MNFQEKEALINELKRDVLLMPESGNVPLNYGIDDIYKIIPHRPPFALIDKLVSVNLQALMIEVGSTINPKDPIFAGHFPGAPVYPGVMLIETMGQAGLCLSYFAKNNTVEINEKSVSVKGLFTRVHNAGFNKGVLPGDTLTIRVKSIEDDDFMGLMSAQIIKNNEVYSHSILEVYYP